MIRYTRTWRNKFLTLDAKTLEDMVNMLQSAYEELDEMLETGVITLEGGADDDYALLVTTDPDVARKYGFSEEENEE